MVGIAELSKWKRTGSDMAYFMIILIALHVANLAVVLNAWRTEWTVTGWDSFRVFLLSMLLSICLGLAIASFHRWI